MYERSITHSSITMVKEIKNLATSSYKDREDILMRKYHKGEPFSAINLWSPTISQPPDRVPNYSGT